MDLKKITVTTYVEEWVEETVLGELKRAKKLRSVSTRADKFLSANGNWEAIRKITAASTA